MYFKSKCKILTFYTKMYDLNVTKSKQSNTKTHTKGSFKTFIKQEKTKIYLY